MFNWISAMFVMMLILYMVASLIPNSIPPPIERDKIFHPDTGN